MSTGHIHSREVRTGFPEPRMWRHGLSSHNLAPGRPNPPDKVHASGAARWPPLTRVLEDEGGGNCRIMALELLAQHRLASRTGSHEVRHSRDAQTSRARAGSSTGHTDVTGGHRGHVYACQVHAGSNRRWSQGEGRAAVLKVTGPPSSKGSGAECAPEREPAQKGQGFRDENFLARVRMKARRMGMVALSTIRTWREGLYPGAQLGVTQRRSDRSAEI